MVSYAIQFPEFAAKAKVGGELDIDPNVSKLLPRFVRLVSVKTYV